MCSSVLFFFSEENEYLIDLGLNMEESITIKKMIKSENASKLSCGHILSFSLGTVETSTWSGTVGLHCIILIYFTQHLFTAATIMGKVSC